MTVQRGSSRLPADVLHVSAELGSYNIEVEIETTKKSHCRGCHATVIAAKGDWLPIAQQPPSAAEPMTRRESMRPRVTCARHERSQAWLKTEAVYILCATHRLRCEQIVLQSILQYVTLSQMGYRCACSSALSACVIAAYSCTDRGLQCSCSIYD